MLLDVTVSAIHDGGQWSIISCPVHSWLTALVYMNIFMMWLCRAVEILGYILNKLELAISHSPRSGIMINNPVWRL